jgi:outer membrane protein OmpA-like peptidoglycan-associated protein
MMHRNSKLGMALAIGMALSSAATAQEPVQTATPKTQIASGQKQKLTGVIVKREADGFVMRDRNGAETNIALTDSVKVEEKKSNPFRGAKKYAVTELMRGLNVEVEGRGNESGGVTAEKIKFSDNSLMVAQSIESRVTPVEGRVDGAETRIGQAEQNAQRLSGQLDELSAISNAARGGAKAAQETADKAIAGVNSTNERITNSVSALDEYEPTKTLTVNFKVRSAVLSPEALAALDEIAEQAKTEKGYIIEVAGFASSDGNEKLNRVLSQQRSEAVVRYLAENQMIPLRRIITPFGYGASQPVADNTTKDGRAQNRRVEVKILSNRGLNTPAPAPAAAAGASSDSTQQQ